MSQPRAEHLAQHAAALGYAVEISACSKLLAYLDAMLQRNRMLNLTAVREPATADVLHGLDSLAFALTGIQPRHGLDLGSGNGFPGVAIATLHPDAEITLLERTGKKARALQELAAETERPNVRVLHLDAAQVPSRHPELQRHFDLVTARAVATPEKVGSLAAPLLRAGGHLVLWLDSGTPAEKPLRDYRTVAVYRYGLPEPAARERQLAVLARR